MVLALRDYVNRNRFPAWCWVFGRDRQRALRRDCGGCVGRRPVWCVMLPSRYTSTESLIDATECAHMLGVKYDTVPIVPAVKAFDEMLTPPFAGRGPDLTEENIQSRIRGVTLMALSNKFGPMLVTTGNKSEMSVGYATIYGDMNGGYNPLKDAYKPPSLPCRNGATGTSRASVLAPMARLCPTISSASRHRPNCAPIRRIRTRCRPMTCWTRSSGPCRA
jgi:NAD+ synthase